MIVRIMGEGQFKVDDEVLEGVNEADQRLVDAIEAGDETGFSTCLKELLDKVRSDAEELPDDHLGPSDYVLPGPDSSLQEIKALLGEEGLLPG